MEKRIVSLSRVDRFVIGKMSEVIMMVFGISKCVVAI